MIRKCGSFWNSFLLAPDTASSHPLIPPKKPCQKWRLKGLKMCDSVLTCDVTCIICENDLGSNYMIWTLTERRELKTILDTLGNRKRGSIKSGAEERKFDELNYCIYLQHHFLQRKSCVQRTFLLSQTNRFLTSDLFQRNSNPTPIFRSQTWLVLF